MSSQECNGEYKNISQIFSLSVLIVGLKSGKNFFPEGAL
jgi:hypothetical protein